MHFLKTGGIKDCVKAFTATAYAIPNANTEAYVHLLFYLVRSLYYLQSVNTFNSRLQSTKLGYMREKSKPSPHISNNTFQLWPIRYSVKFMFSVMLAVMVKVIYFIILAGTKKKPIVIWKSETPRCLQKI